MESPEVNHTYFTILPGTKTWWKGHGYGNICTDFLFFLPFSQMSNTNPRRPKNLGHHKCPLSRIKDDREREHRHDDLERFYLLDSFQDTCFTKSCSKSLLCPFLLSPDKFKASSLPEDKSLQRNCQQSLIHVLCYSMLESFSRAFNSPLRVNWVLWQGTQSPTQAAPEGPLCSQDHD